MYQTNEHNTNRNIAIPIIEIMLFIKIGENIGALNTILLIILTAVVGIYFARIQGLKTLKSGFINIYQNKVPYMRYFQGFIAIAALFLIILDFYRHSWFIINSFHKTSYNFNAYKKDNYKTKGKI